MSSTPQPRTRLARSCGILLLLMVGGCSVVDDCQRVTGVVTVDGVPLELGAIRFMPVDELAANSSGATVRDGAFELPASCGLRPGRYTVEVLAYRQTGQTLADPQIGEYPELEELKFEQSDLEAVVTKDGPNHFEFALTLAPLASAVALPEPHNGRA